MSPRVPRFDRFMVSNDIGRDLTLRNRFTIAERWCWVAGVLGLASDSPIRGWLFINEADPATPKDIADNAGVPNATARTTLAKARRFGWVKYDDTVKCDHVPFFDDYNPPSKKDPTNAERQRRYKERQRGVSNGAGNGQVTPPVTPPVTLISNGGNADEVEVEVEGTTSPSSSVAEGRR